MSDNGHTWVSVAEAARLTGKSERTVRRWVTDGRLPKREDATGLRVALPDNLAAPDRQEEATPDMPDAGARVAELEAECRRLAAVLEAVTGERDYLRLALDKSLSSPQLLLPARAGHPGLWARLRQWVAGTPAAE